MHAEHKLSAIRSAAVMGERVAVFAYSVEECRDLLEAFARVQVMADLVHARKLRGGVQVLEFPASHGVIQFRPMRGIRGARAMNFDRVFLPINCGPEAVRAIMPSLDASGGVLVGYL